MRVCRGCIAGIVGLTFIFALGIFFNSCSSNFPNQPVEEGTELSPGTLEKRGSGLLSGSKHSYPQSTSLALKLVGRVYEGGLMRVPNGSSFEVKKGSLLAPLKLVKALLRGRLSKIMTLTMQVDLVKNPGIRGLGDKALIYTFGPHGSQFRPAAKAWFDFSDLGTRSPKVYYIDEDDQLHELKPERIDYEKKRLLLHVDHFSRYAVSWGN